MYLHNVGMVGVKQILIVTCLVSGCGGVQWASLRAPAPHPLLDSQGWRSQASSAHPPMAQRRGNPSQFFGVVQRNINGLKHTRYRRQTEELNLLRAVFRGTAVHTVLKRIRSIDELRGEGKRITRATRVGDILFFDRNEKSPRVAVVLGRSANGTITAVAVHLGRARKIKVHPVFRGVRRRKGRILNTIIRAVRPGDKRGKRYLAGDALQETRRVAFTR